MEVVIMEQLSKISTIMQELGKIITEDEERFLDIPIYYSMMELIADNIPDTAVVFEILPFRYDSANCTYERQLDVIIVHNTDYEREIILRLTKYAEDMIELFDWNIMSHSGDYELQFLQGSEIRAKRNNREDAESYKGSKTLFSSLIVLSYMLRY